MDTLNINEILEILPHRYPFIMVDRIVEMDVEQKRIAGIKNLAANEPFFQGHFPSEPIMPGVLQLEAMAQVGGILLNKITQREGDVAYFLSVDNAKFRGMARPGDQLRIEVEFNRLRMGMAKVHGIAKVDGKIVSEADLMFGGGRG